MSNNIDFKSKVLIVANYKDVDISSFIVQYEPDLEQIEEELLVLRKKHAELVEVKEVSIGDIALLSCKSENKKFNKEGITINVGKGLFNKELENNLLGMKKAEEKEFVVNGDKVCTRIDKISRNVIPELTDENAIKWNFEGLKSVKELRKWFIDKQHEEFIKDNAFNAALYIEGQVVEKSSFALDEGDLSRAHQNGQKMASDMMRDEGTPLDTMTEEQAQEILGSSVEDYIARVQDVCISSLKTSILGSMLMKKEQQHLPTIEDYETELKKRNGNSETDIEEAKQTYTIENYMNEFYGNYYFDTLENYAINYLKERER